MLMHLLLTRVPLSLVEIDTHLSKKKCDGTIFYLRDDDDWVATVRNFSSQSVRVLGYYDCMKMGCGWVAVGCGEVERSSLRSICERRIGRLSRKRREYWRK